MRWCKIYVINHNESFERDVWYEVITTIVMKDTYDAKDFSMRPRKRGSPIKDLKSS